MKNHTPTKYPRTLAIAPSGYGVGFALIEGFDTLADWGLKRISGDKNESSLQRVNELLSHYEPELLVMQNTEVKTSRRSPRIKKLNKKIKALAQEANVKVLTFTREAVKEAFLPNGKGNKHDLALAIADRFPEELALRVPPERKAWMTEDSRVNTFEAVALALMTRIKKRSC